MIRQAGKWRDGMQENCRGHPPLPGPLLRRDVSDSEPRSGSRLCTIGDSVPTPDPGPAAEPPPHWRVQTLTVAVQSLVDTHALTGSRGRRLEKRLADANDALTRGKVREVTARLDAFVALADALVATGEMRRSDATTLIVEARAIGAQVEALALRPGSARPASWSLEGCPERQPCTYAVVFVDDDLAVSGPRDGTLNRPFRTIAAALKHADAIHACGVEIRVADGIYRENVVIRRDTIIEGESRDATVILGAVVNNAGAVLTVRNVSLSAVNRPGGLFTDALCAITTVADVRMDGSVRFGIYQRGGVLTVLRSIIRNTAADAGSRVFGTAIYLTGGVQAVIGLTELTGNETAGIVATAGQTRVYAASVSVTGTTVHPFFSAEASGLDDVPTAVDVSDGALLLMEFSAIVRNELIGLRVREGAQAHFRYGTIARTRQIEGFETRGTANAAAIADGTILELSSFTLRRGSLVGLFVSEAFVTASNGTISRHPIGLAVQGLPPPSDPDYDIESAVECLMEDVRYERNDFPLDASSLPVPCPPGQECPRATCRRVPFVCSWCDRQ